MKTKYILHGGFNPGEMQINDMFFKEIFAGTPKKLNRLLVYFAKEADRIAKNRQEDVVQFEKNKGDKFLKFETANSKQFEEQVKKADVVYLHGGHSGMLLEALRRYQDIGNHFKGKIVAGDSAGANVLGEAFYSMKIGASEGLGLIPYKIVSHFIEENKHKLSNIKPELETIYLREYEFIVIEV